MSQSDEHRGPTGSGDEGREAGFKVIDRRRFSADGEERVPESDAAAPPAAPKERESAPSADPGFVLKETSEDPTAGVPEANISSLFLGLSTQALMHLGEIPDPESGASERDLPSARSLIDLLALLREKTRGNLDAEESGLLDRILYDLRMRFVEIARGK